MAKKKKLSGKKISPYIATRENDLMDWLTGLSRQRELLKKATTDVSNGFHVLHVLLHFCRSSDSFITI